MTMNPFAPPPEPSPPSAAESSPGHASEPGLRLYRVFLSYSHADTRWATWLIRRLEGYTIPARLRGRRAPIGITGRSLAPVFRDREELPTAHDLGETIRDALRRSATLVVICSPSAARSRWVNEEISSFKRLHGGQRVFAFIVAGEPGSSDAATECFPPALRFHPAPAGSTTPTPAEVIAADARPHGDGKSAAFLRLVAGLLGVGYDDLRQRELQRRYRRMTWITTTSVLGMALTLGLAAVAWQARDDARRRQEQGEDLVAFMLGELHAQVEKIGRLDVLKTVPEKATAYFDSLDLRDLTDTSLARQAKALTKIGDIRFAETNYPEAMRAYKTAYDRTAALAARHPRDGTMLFERGQAEFGIGMVHRKRGEVGPMTEWFTRYRDTGAALVALDPAYSKWHEELAFGLHNLAVLDLDEGRLDAARTGFLAELEALNHVVRERPQDLPLQFRVVDVNSWLGTIAERSGDLREASARFTRQVAQLEAMVKADPGNARWRARLADAFGLHASILAITGDPAASLAQRARARALYDELVKGDPQNRVWLRASLHSRLREAELLRADGNSAAAIALAGEVRSRFSELARTNPKDVQIQTWLAFALRLEAELSGDPGQTAAREAARQAVEIGERLLAEAGAKASDSLLGECALGRIVAGRLAARAGESAAARTHWLQALQHVAPRLPDSTHWRILWPATIAHRLLGDAAASAALQARLRLLGFTPLPPHDKDWPSAAPPSQTSP